MLIKVCGTQPRGLLRPDERKALDERKWLILDELVAAINDRNTGLAFLPDARTARYTLIEAFSTDLERVAELLEKYDGLPLGCTPPASVL